MLRGGTDVAYEKTDESAYGAVTDGHEYYMNNTTVYQRTPDIAIDLSRKLGRGALRGQFLFYYFSYKIKVGLSNMENTSLIH